MVHRIGTKKKKAYACILHPHELEGKSAYLLSAAQSPKMWILQRIHCEVYEYFQEEETAALLMALCMWACGAALVPLELKKNWKNMVLGTIR